MGDCWALAESVDAAGAVETVETVETVDAAVETVDAAGDVDAAGAAAFGAVVKNLGQQRRHHRQSTAPIECSLDLGAPLSVFYSFCA